MANFLYFDVFLDYLNSIFQYSLWNISDDSFIPSVTAATVILALICIGVLVAYTSPRKLKTKVETVSAKIMGTRPRFRKRDKVMFYGRKMLRKVQMFSAHPGQQGTRPRIKKRQLVLKLARKILPLRGEQPLTLKVMEPSQAFLEEAISEQSEHRLPPDVMYMLKSIRVFGSFEKPLFLELCKHIETLQILSGSLLFSIGEPDDSIYVVQSGKLIVYVTESDGSELILKEVTAGENITSLLSVMDALTGCIAPYKSVSARAMEDCVVLRLKVEAFRSLLEKNPESLVRVAQIIMVRLQRVTFTALHNYLGLTRQLIKTSSTMTRRNTTSTSPKASPSRSTSRRPSQIVKQFSDARNIDLNSLTSEADNHSVQFSESSNLNVSGSETEIQENKKSRKRKASFYFPPDQGPMHMEEDLHSLAVQGFVQQLGLEIAAKIHSGVETTGTKRPIEEVGATLGLPEAKKLAVSDDNKGIPQQLTSLQAQRSIGAIANAITVEEWKVPDKMVGLIIGRGGEQITRLQAESGCKVQMAADSGGLPERICTLTGLRQAIEKAKELISAIINRGGPPLPVLDTNHVPDGHSIVEMMIPGPKVGLVIGKGGETIRNLQERAAVKMVLIQDGPQQTSQEKPLRITGEPDKCEYAKQLVMDLITEKELESIQRSSFDGTNEYGSSAGGQRSGNTHEIMVPKQAVGVVIGKGGDMIKKIQQDSGARVQFLNVKDEGPEDKVCVVTGTPEQIQAASSFINDLIQSVLVRDQQNVGRGRGRGRPDGSGPNFGNNPRNRPDLPEIHYAVPANKCGLVIGKGGETVKNINQVSGAYVTLSALPPPNAQEKVFVIRGQPPQIDHAKELINERIGGVGTVIQSQNPQNQQNFSPQFQQQQQFQQAPTPAQPYAPQGWANAYQPWQGQAAPATDPNAAAWAAYYQYYGQQAHQMQQPAAQAAMQPGTAPAPGMPSQPDQNQNTSQQPPAATPAAAVPAAAAPVGAAIAQQPDYSAAWAEYYRSLGMFREAELIETQARTQMTGAVMTPQPGQTFPQGQGTSAAPVQAPAPGAAPQPTPQAAAPPSQPPPASVPPAAPPVQQPPAGAQQPPAPTGVPAPPGHPQPFPPGGPQGQWPTPAPFAQPFGQQQPNAFVGYNYPNYGQQTFAAAAPQ